MKIALICCNLGGHTERKEYAPQVLFKDYTLETFYLDDSSFPIRASMTPRMQAKIPKMLGYKIYPGFDFYVWVDASFSIPRPDSIKWLMEKKFASEMAFFKHPHRNTVKEESDFLYSEMMRENKYILSRYENEVVNPEWFKTEIPLLAAGVFVYGNSSAVRRTLQEWYFQTVTSHVDDQLSLPWCIDRHDVSVNVIEDKNILHNEYFVHHSHK